MNRRRKVTVQALGGILMLLVPCSSASAVTLVPDSFLNTFTYSFLPAPDHYSLEASDKWKVVGANNAVDYTWDMVLTVSIARYPAGAILDADIESAPGVVFSQAEVGDVVASQWYCYLAQTDITLTPAGGGPTSYPTIVWGYFCLPPEPSYPVASCWDGGGWETCEDCERGDTQDPGTCINPDSTCCASPIVIDLRRRGFQLTGANDPVDFDLLLTGHRDHFGWTAPGGGDGFLALDRNRNGLIDNGAELFGNHTTGSGGPLAGNGFKALAAFDSPDAGGNGDGVIDARDAVFRRLRVWIDENHNGISEANELHTLAEVGLVRIDLGYRTVKRQDQFGNLLRNWGTATIVDEDGKEKKIDTCDVVFVKVP